MYATVWSGHHYSIDGVIYFQYAKSVLFHGAFIMDPPIRWGFDISAPELSIGMSIAHANSRDFVRDSFLP
jgi:hypothetical protein